MLRVPYPRPLKTLDTRKLTPSDPPASLPGQACLFCSRPFLLRHDRWAHHIIPNLCDSQVPRLALATAPFCHAFPPRKTAILEPVVCEFGTSFRYTVLRIPSARNTAHETYESTLGVTRAPGQQKLKLHHERKTLDAMRRTIPVPRAPPPPNRPQTAIHVPGTTRGIGCGCGLSYFARTTGGVIFVCGAFLFHTTAFQQGSCANRA